MIEIAPHSIPMNIVARSPGERLGAASSQRLVPTHAPRQALQEEAPLGTSEANKRRACRGVEPNRPEPQLFGQKPRRPDGLSLVVTARSRRDAAPRIMTSSTRSASMITNNTSSVMRESAMTLRSHSGQLWLSRDRAARGAAAIEAREPWS